MNAKKKRNGESCDRKWEGEEENTVEKGVGTGDERQARCKQ